MSGGSLPEYTAGRYLSCSSEIPGRAWSKVSLWEYPGCFGSCHWQPSDTYPREPSTLKKEILIHALNRLRTINEIIDLSSKKLCLENKVIEHSGACATIFYYLARSTPFFFT